ncbi:MAG: hypothetical protein KAH77_00190 [Thiomargarita sp.]|nr:hypothetical protein [Thiomargarita sp.]
MISTTVLAKSLGISPKELFVYFLKCGFIRKSDDNSWILTAEGEKKGGTYKESKQYGKYIVWSKDMSIEIPQPTSVVTLISATAIGNQFELSAHKINAILSELEWIYKGVKGWLLTELGEKQGGIQKKDQQSDMAYVVWPDSITETKSFKETVTHIKSIGDKNKTPAEKVGFREKFEAQHRSADGHFVRSKAEMLIDNWLYMAEIVHAYERKLPIEEDVYSDFYIPTGKVYIEYWGYDNESKYLARKKTKIAIYKKYSFNLIELQDKEVQNLDDHLPRLLLKYGVQTY